MLTPEGRVKAAVKKLLLAQGCYFHMPVMNGMGAPTLDFVGCHRGRFFAVETKAKGSKVTLRQQATINDITLAGGMAFVVSADAGMDLLIAWLEVV